MSRVGSLVWLLRHTLGAGIIAVALAGLGLVAQEKPVSPQPDSGRIEPFKIAVKDAVLRDLKDRLALSRWPDQLDGTGWEYGVPVDYMKGLVEYWRTRYDWRDQE